jgi:hypothetical protein
MLRINVETLDLTTSLVKFVRLYVVSGGLNLRCVNTSF